MGTITLAFFKCLQDIMGMITLVFFKCSEYLGNNLYLLINTKHKLFTTFEDFVYTPKSSTTYNLAYNNGHID